MKTASQVIFHFTSLLVVLVVGLLFANSFEQAQARAEFLLHGKPLPAVTEFFVEHSLAPVYLPLLPWLWLAGAPLLTLRESRDYWQASSFVLRVLAFLGCETLLIVVLVFALFAPFISYYEVLRGGPPSRIDMMLGLLSALLVTLVPAIGLWRALQIYHGRKK